MVAEKDAAPLGYGAAVVHAAQAGAAPESLTADSSYVARYCQCGDAATVAESVTSDAYQRGAEIDGHKAGAGQKGIVANTCDIVRNCQRGNRVSAESAVADVY